jgi:hypothetical protein
MGFGIEFSNLRKKEDQNGETKAFQGGIIADCQDTERRMLNDED